MAKLTIAKKGGAPVAAAGKGAPEKAPMTRKPAPATAPAAAAAPKAEKPAKSPKAPKATPQEGAERKIGRATILIDGVGARRFARWAGAEGWTNDEIAAYLESRDAAIPRSSVCAYSKMGKDGTGAAERDTDVDPTIAAKWTKEKPKNVQPSPRGRKAAAAEESAE